MTQQQAIEHACQTMALVYHSLGNYDESSDGFCHRCPNNNSPSYRNEGDALRYVRRAVVNQLKRDRVKIADGFDPKTGDPQEGMI